MTIFIQARLQAPVPKTNLAAHVTSEFLEIDAFRWNCDSKTLKFIGTARPGISGEANQSFLTLEGVAVSSEQQGSWVFHVQHNTGKLLAFYYLCQGSVGVLDQLTYSVHLYVMSPASKINKDKCGRSKWYDLKLVSDLLME